MKNIERVLVLSTAHINFKTSQKLDEAHSGGLPFRWSIHEYGYIIWVPSEVKSVNDFKKHNIEELVDVLRYAKEKGCTMVNFDADAEIINKLKQFEWS